jgi:hypothetical protein
MTDAAGIQSLKKLIQRQTMNNRSHTWSQDLQSQTRDAVAKVLVNPFDEKLHFKNRDSRYAFMTAEDLLQDKLSLVDKVSGEKSEFQDVDALLLGGWAID